jgi:hypothetical protein
MRSGQAYTEVVPFNSGFPDGAIAYSLYDNGTLTHTGTVTPAAGAVSANIQIPGSWNALGTGVVLGARDLQWSYTSAAVAISGERRYKLEALLPFNISADGVRVKLGFDVAADLPDSQIPLTRAYLDFQARVTSTLLTPFETGASYDQMVIADAIEAMAALALIPTLQVRVAKSESSGSNTYERMDVDWTVLAEYLMGYVATALTAVSPKFTFDGGSLFVLSTPPDLFPG